MGTWQRAGHLWVPGENPSAATLNTHPEGLIGLDISDNDQGSITSSPTIVLQTPACVVQSNRRLRALITLGVTVASGSSDDLVVVQFYIDNVLSQTWQFHIPGTAREDRTFKKSLTQNSGSTRDYDVRVSRGSSGSGTITVKAGAELEIEDLTSTT